jgi:cytochrome P450
LTTGQIPEYPSVQAAECPFELYDWLRSDEPVFQLPAFPNMYFLTRYEDVRAILGDPASFTSQHHLRDFIGFELLIGREDGPPPMIDADEPLHKELRTMASSALKPVRVKSYEPIIREIVDDIIEGFIDDGKVEFVEQFSHALPVRLTLKLMGVPQDDAPAIREWAKLESAGLRFLSREFNQAQQARSTAMNEYLRERILERYEQRTDDVISDVIDAHLAQRGRFDIQEVLPQVAILLGGGVGTTAHFLASVMLLLVQNPEQMAHVRADHGLIPRAIEEALRLEGPLQWLTRRVVRDVTVRGVKIPKESFVLLSLGAAGRDGDRFRCPTHFDVRRERPQEHMAFGYGLHFCLGAPLARLEMRLGFERLLTRLANIRLAAGADLRHIKSPQMRGLVRLDLEFDRAV